MILFPRFPLADGLSISRIVTGMGQLADLQRKDPDFDVDRAALAMSPYVDAGLTTFDMAESHGPAEDIAGIFGERAERITQWAPAPGPVSREATRDAVLKSMARLRTTRIDLLQFHAWSFAHPSWLDALLHLQEIKREGLIEHLGVTNFDTAHLRMAVQSGIEIVSNQISFSVLDQRAAGAMSAYCVSHGVRLIAYGTLLGGFFSEAWLGKDEPDWDALETPSLMKYGRFIRAAGGWHAFQQVLRRLDEIANKHGVPIATVASRITLGQEGVAAIVIGARLSKSQHIDDTLRVFDLTLDDEDLETLAQGMKYLKPIPGDCGDEYRRPPYLTESGRSGQHGENPPPYVVKPGPRGRTLIVSSSTWTSGPGASSAHRLDDRIWISSTTARYGDRLIGGNDPRSQFHFIVDRIEGALISLGAALADVVRTRILVRNAYDCDDITQAYADRFRHVLPANALVPSDLPGDETLVEVEAEAVVSS